MIGFMAAKIASGKLDLCQDAFRCSALEKQSRRTLAPLQLSTVAGETVAMKGSVTVTIEKAKAKYASRKPTCQDDAAV